ncbi:MAG: hypothetical protein AAFR79_00795 [Pseudomonadota bacterium]
MAKRKPTDLCIEILEQVAREIPHDETYADFRKEVNDGIKEIKSLRDGSAGSAIKNRDLIAIAIMKSILELLS